MSDFFIPFNHEPDSVLRLSVGAPTYTVPAGYYARIVSHCVAGIHTYRPNTVTALNLTAGNADVDSVVDPAANVDPVHLTEMHEIWLPEGAQFSSTASTPTFGTKTTEFVLPHTSFVAVESSIVLRVNSSTIFGLLAKQIYPVTSTITAGSFIGPSTFNVVQVASYATFNAQVELYNRIT